MSWRRLRRLSLALFASGLGTRGAPAALRSPRYPRHLRQNGFLDSFLEEKGLADNTQALIFFAVAKKGEAPTDGKKGRAPLGGKLRHNGHKMGPLACSC